MDERASPLTPVGMVAAVIVVQIKPSQWSWRASVIPWVQWVYHAATLDNVFANPGWSGKDVTSALKGFMVSTSRDASLATAIASGVYPLLATKVAGIRIWEEKGSNKVKELKEARKV